MFTERFIRMPLMGIMRGITSPSVEPLIRTVGDAGLEAIEITMNTQGAPELISAAKSVADRCISVGAGTVVDMEGLKVALDSGAEFIVMPAANEDIIEYCVREKIPVFPGALTPGEVLKAWKAGAFMVKVFPGGFFGPRYFKELKGPFNDIKLMAVGGVRADNLKEYFDNGADAAAFGSSVFKKEWLKSGDFVSIGKVIKMYVDIVKSVKNIPA